jgi:SAM-dependent methyltransferase
MEYWDGRLSADPSLRGTGHVSYDEHYNRWMYKRKGDVLARALRPVAAGSRALDIGSGVGWVIEAVQAAGAAHVDGADIAPAAVALLQKRFPGSTIVCHAVGGEPLPFPSASYDLVTMMDVAYHITDDDLLAAGLRDIARLLVADGVLLVSDGLGAASREPAPHVRFRSRSAWESMAQDAGLRIDVCTALYSWLSRDIHESRLRVLPDRVRGAFEYAGERVVPRRPHLQLATLRRTG